MGNIAALSASFFAAPSSVVLQSGDFETDLDGIVTPGTDAEAGAVAWTRQVEGATATTNTGPGGGSNSGTRAVEATGNAYLYVESSDNGGAETLYTAETAEFDASLGTVTLEYHFHCYWNSANDGTFRAQVWNGTTWLDRGITISSRTHFDELDAYSASSAMGTINSMGLSNSDCKFRWVQTKPDVGADRFQYDTGIDNFTVTRSVGGGQQTPGTRAEALLNGLRTIFVETNGSDSNDGLSEANPKLTAQAAFNIAQDGDAIIFGDGIWDEQPTFNNKAGTGTNKILIAARNAGETIFASVWTQARDNFNGLWTDEGGGVYSTARTSRPFLATDTVTGDMLFYYGSEADLRAGSITAFSAIAGANRTISKPSYGFAFTGSRVFVRLRNNANPNQRSLLFTNDFSSTILTCNDSTNFIVDGIRFIGAGNTFAINQNNGSDSTVITNCIFDLTKFAVKTHDNTILRRCTFRYQGHDIWRRDVLALDGKNDYGPFVLCKGYYNGALTGTGGGSANAILEGGINNSRAISPEATGVIIEYCTIGPVFEGCRIGECSNSTVRFCTFVGCGDDGIQNEGSNGEVSADNEIHDCKFLNCFRDISRQSNSIVGDSFVYRCLFIHTDPDVQIRNSDSLKWVNTPAGSDDFVYHCIWDFDAGISSGGYQRIYTDFGGSASDADKIERLFNSIMILPRDFSDGSGSNPQTIENNLTVGPSSGAMSVLTGTNGQYAGTAKADALLNDDYSLAAGSDAIGLGRSLPGGLPDSRGDNTDAGIFPFGETVPANWPVPATATFFDEVPFGWPQAGAT